MFIPDSRLSADGEKGPLTAGELEILTLMASDLTLDEIGCELGISRKKMNATCRSIYAKLGVTSRYGAITEGFMRAFL